MAHVTKNTGNMEWNTPPYIVDAARAAMGVIDLDPCTNLTAQEYIKASVFYTISVDGLSVPWYGNIWMNPPYRKKFITPFVEHLCDEALSGNVSQFVCITNNATETPWAQRLLAVCEAVCFPFRRVRFYDLEGKRQDSPLQGHMITYSGDRVDQFTLNFSEIGIVIPKGWPPTYNT